MVRDVEEVRRSKVLVSLRIAGDQRRHVDRGLDRRELGVLGGIDDGAGYAGEATPDLREHHVTDAEFGQAVARVDVPHRPGLDGGRGCWFGNGRHEASLLRAASAMRHDGAVVATTSTLA